MDLESLVESLVGAASSSGKALFERAGTFVVPELRQVASRIIAIEAGVKSGELTEKLAKQLMAMQADSAVDVIIAMTELTVFEAEKLINAALRAVRDVVNTAIGFKML
jgi:Asp-tRNA(Asn)/Glu-tRNA(Gln) amidotransferase B subunit